MNNVAESAMIDFNIMQFACLYKNFYGSDWTIERKLKIDNENSLRIAGNIFRGFGKVQRYLIINIMKHNGSYYKECNFSVMVDLDTIEINTFKHKVKGAFYKEHYEDVKGKLSKLINMYNPPKNSKYGIWGQIK